MVRCPGQDQRFWKPQDIFEVQCHGCGNPIEFFKDEPKLKCRKCGEMVPNPKVYAGCAQWCQHARQCTDAPAGQQANLVNGKTDQDTEGPSRGPRVV